MGRQQRGAGEEGQSRTPMPRPVQSRPQPMVPGARGVILVSPALCGFTRAEMGFQAVAWQLSYAWRGKGMGGCSLLGALELPRRLLNQARKQLAAPHLRMSPHP